MAPAYVPCYSGMLQVLSNRTVLSPRSFALLPTWQDWTPFDALTFSQPFDYRKRVFSSRVTETSTIILISYSVSREALSQYFMAQFVNKSARVGYRIQPRCSKKLCIYACRLRTPPIPSYAFFSCSDAEENHLVTFVFDSNSYIWKRYLKWFKWLGAPSEV